MRTLGDDLMMLAPARGGWNRTSETLEFGLRGAELVELVAAGRLRVQVKGGPIRVLVADPAPTGDSQLDRVLAWTVRQHTPPHPTEWLRRQVWKAADAYRARNQEAGSLGRAAVRARLDRILRGGDTGKEGEARDRALAGLVHVSGVGGKLYRGPLRRGERRRLAEAAKRDWGALTVQRSLPHHFTREIWSDSSSTGHYISLMAGDIADL